MTSKAFFQKNRLFLANTSERQAFSLVETFFHLRVFSKGNFFVSGEIVHFSSRIKSFFCATAQIQKPFAVTLASICTSVQYDKNSEERNI